MNNMKRLLIWLGIITEKPPLLDNKDAKKVIPWEPVGQILPAELPDKAPEGYPAPWTREHRGNGHFDVIANDGTYVAHVFIWDRNYGEVFDEKLKKINGE